VISARPIISAEAVTAVRAGLRTEFWRASRPAAPPVLAAGHASTDASGLTSRDEINATPTNSTKHPTASRSSTQLTERPGANMPNASRPTPAAIAAPAA
jgi:hypothetical protein